MKKIFLLASVAVMALAISCTKEAPDSQTRMEGEEVAVTFTAALDGAIGTRALGDGNTVNELYWTIYDMGYQYDPQATFVSSGKKTSAFQSTPLKESVTINLLIGHYYNIVFWAQSSDSYYQYNDGTVSLNYQLASPKFVPANQDIMDAFFACVPVNKFDPQTTVNVKMTRPFAQINVGASDWDEAKTLLAATGKKISTSACGVDFGDGYGTDVIQTFDLLNNKLNKVQNPTFGFATLPNSTTVAGEVVPAKISVNGTEYDHILTAYVFTTKQTLDNFTLYTADDDGNSVGAFSVSLTKLNVNNVPIQRNYRTNIVGNVLTQETDFNITIDPILKDLSPITKASLLDEDDDVLDYTAGGIYTAPSNYLYGKTIKFSSNAYGGLTHPSDTLTFEQCTIEGVMFGYTKLKFIDCTFTNTGGGASGNYPIWTYGASKATFINCTFENHVTKAILVYNEGGINNVDVVVSGCNFQASNVGHNQHACVEIHTEANENLHGNLYIDQCTKSTVYTKWWAEYKNERLIPILNPTSTNFNVFVNNERKQTSTYNSGN